ncbi:YggS family pyridoxal phosphate-dependent enzyme [Agromyces atrinae]|uniref:YggS family pyridoxal phosphate-dependent enzyme n=1 Tax=Agromyces atrinae TaxID=592376 RepID=UPI001F5ABC66|nr:YggS family pyridoxal phosphate-dependent enzyme [Agromyces atrinae]MCI2958821.1 YggS family pyridoxal phosphate-dependent enzyme [Agromyces atrinae]
MSENLASRLRDVSSAVAAAAADADRDVSEITTIVVTKFHPAALVAELADLGVRDVGENRHQEAQAKAAELSGLGLSWHFIGQLQSKKARQVRAYASSIHSIDRPALVDALRSDDDVIDGFVQVNLTDDAGRGGVLPAELDALVEKVLETPGIRLRGLMAVAPLDGEPRRAFARVRELSESVRRTAPEASALSMGMSQDFREAILEGATHLRIGTLITGNRPTPGLTSN